MIYPNNRHHGNLTIRALLRALPDELHPDPWSVDPKVSGLPSPTLLARRRDAHLWLNRMPHSVAVRMVAREQESPGHLESLYRLGGLSALRTLENEIIHLIQIDHA